MLIARIYLPVCTCGKYIGKKQKEYEEKLISMQLEQGIDETNYRNEENIEKMRQIELKLMTDFGWTKICCRKTLVCNSQTPFIRNSNSKCYVDVVSNTERNGYEFRSKKTELEFPDI